LFKVFTMKVVKVELLNDNALKLLELLEQLKIIKIGPKIDANNASKKQWAGAISKETATNMLQHIEKTKSEWERI
jgi:CMP-2-keto-3-deoxyoctulosonic acid synthetase